MYMNFKRGRRPWYGMTPQGRRVISPGSQKCLGNNAIIVRAGVREREYIPVRRSRDTRQHEHKALQHLSRCQAGLLHKKLYTDCSAVVVKPSRTDRKRSLKA